METIKAPASIPPIGSSTSQGKNPQSNRHNLHFGQLLKAEVVENQGEGRFLLDIAGTRMTASSRVKLSVGQNLQLQVLQTQPRIELKIVGDSLNRYLGRSLTLIGKNIDLGPLFASFTNRSPSPLESLSQSSRQTLENFFSTQQGSLQQQSAGVTLKHLIDSLGLNLETLLADGRTGSAAHTLKAALLEMAHTFQHAKAIAESTNRILTVVELFQVLQLQLGSDSLFLLPLPVQFIDQGYLIIKTKDGEKDSTKDEHEEFVQHFSLHLTISPLGHLQIDFSRDSNDNLTIHFHTASQEIAHYLSTFTDELQESISGTTTLSTRFTGDAPDPIHDLVRQLLPRDSSILNTTV